MMFNAFAKSLVLFAKSHCPASEKSAIKKAFKLFDPSSQKYTSDFTKRVMHGDGLGSHCLKGDTEILPGVTVAVLEANTPSDKSAAIKGTMHGMLVAASLAQDSVDNRIVADIVSAILYSSVDSLSDVVFDEDLMDSIAKVVDGGLADDVRRSLVKIQAVQANNGSGASASNGPGLMQLAQEVSQGLDMSTLMGVAGQGTADDASMAKLFESINQTVIQRMQDGSLDPAKLCAEASSILGAHGQLSGKM